MTVSTAAPAPKENLFGICAALGEDFGFDPLYLRIALSVGILWNPLAMFGGYAALGLVVLATRLIAPDAKPAAVEQPVERALTEAANGDEHEFARAA